MRLSLAGSYDEFAERAGALEGLDGGRQRVRRRDEADRRGRAKVKLMGALGVTGLGGCGTWRDLRGHRLICAEKLLPTSLL